MTMYPDDESETKRRDKNFPQHIAIIMDGNNRWSKLHHQSGLSGHRAGADAARKLVYLCVDKNINFLTLFVFSSENWSRPQKEVNGLMALFLSVLQRKEVDNLDVRNIKLQFIGNRVRFSSKLQRLMLEAEELTVNNTGMTVIVAADYGGRWDIANAASAIAHEVEQGRLTANEVNVETVHKYIALGDVPMPDLCIRTGGEKRISNFLLWQLAYTEFYFTDTLWPDFGSEELEEALNDFAGRQRRYGKVGEQVENS